MVGDSYLVGVCAMTHREVALKLLAGRSVVGGLPWSREEDLALVGRERVLWLAMTDEEREADSAWLRGLWGGRGVARAVDVDPSWGAWTAKVAGGRLVIPDSAFEWSGGEFRPWTAGPWGDGGVPWGWLWVRGFQVVAVDGAGDVATLACPPHRIVQESERLVAVLAKSGVVLELGGPLWCTGAYDPVTGRATLTLGGCRWLASRLNDR